MSAATQSQNGMQTSVLPVGIAGSLVSELSEEGYCDFCCKPLKTAFQAQCGHCFCGECLIAIGQQDDFEVCPDTLREAAKAVSEGKAVTLKSEQLRGAADAAQGPRVCCPMCLRPVSELTVLDPQTRMRGGLCEECRQAPRALRCAQCGHELCEECDGRIHSFATTRAHSRVAIAAPGNAGGAPIALPCQAACHAQVLQRQLLSAAGASGAQGWLDTSVQRPADYFCLESSELICEGCQASEFYRGKNVQRVPQAVEQRARTLRAETDKCRALSLELRGLLHRHEECGGLDGELCALSLHELRYAHEAARKLVDDRFQALIEATEELLAVRRAKTAQSSEDIHRLAQDMMDAVSSGEKRMIGRQPTVFLSEFSAVLERIRAQYTKAISKLEKMPEPKKLAFPKLRGFPELQQAAADLRLDETQKLVEKVGYVTKAGVQCKECGTTLLPGARTLREAARKQKGCLYGVPPEALGTDAVRLDPLRGAPGSRHVLCGSCGREVGRWSEPDAPEKKFTPGFVFLSSNAVK